MRRHGDIMGRSLFLKKGDDTDVILECSFLDQRLAA